MEKYVIVRCNSTSGRWVVERNTTPNSIAAIAGYSNNKRKAQKIADKLNKDEDKA